MYLQDIENYLLRLGARHIIQIIFMKFATRPIDLSVIAGGDPIFKREAGGGGGVGTTNYNCMLLCTVFSIFLQFGGLSKKRVWSGSPGSFTPPPSKLDPPMLIGNRNYRFTPIRLVPLVNYIQLHLKVSGALLIPLHSQVHSSQAVRT